VALLACNALHLSLLTYILYIYIYIYIGKMQRLASHKQLLMLNCIKLLADYKDAEIGPAMKVFWFNWHAQMLTIQLWSGIAYERDAICLLNHCVENTRREGKAWDIMVWSKFPLFPLQLAPCQWSCQWFRLGEAAMAIRLKNNPAIRVHVLNARRHGDKATRHDTGEHPSNRE